MKLQPKARGHPRRDARTEEDEPKAAPPSDVPSSDSATLTAHRTIRSVSALMVSSGPETSSTPGSRPVAGSATGAAVHAQSWWVRTRCSAENSCTAPPVTRASLMALVPIPASDQSAPRRTPAGPPAAAPPGCPPATGSRRRRR
ncbi:hypothetical protein [Arthrobacter sp. SLBN-122]|uniref:hypothetical protein n=1 Tax=Arthrobacter sp. SLBN-122 TaxID=2768455 RepID=UPI001F16360F|nr:hypothetical protein [Arthrobacter sp. SLBN-122]